MNKQLTTDHRPLTTDRSSVVRKSVVYGLLSVVIALILVTYGYTQRDKSVINAVLQYQVNLEKQSGVVFAILTKAQNLPDGKALPKGTRFIGKINKEEQGGLKFLFETVQLIDGKKEKFLGKTNLTAKEVEELGGISSKIGRTIYKKTQSSVLGAIFAPSKGTNSGNSSTLPKGTAIAIEVE